MDVTAIIPLQPYNPFRELAHKLVNDLAFQTVNIKIITSLQEPEGFIRKGKLYDQHIDDVKTSHILFVDADMELPPEFCEHMLNSILHTDVLYGVFQKRPNWRKTADGCWMMKKSDWLKFRESKNYEKFMSIQGIPAGMGWIMEWITDNLSVGYMTEYPLKLRLPGNTARKHQGHSDRHRARRQCKDFVADGRFKVNWELVGDEWLSRKDRPPP